MFFFKRNFVIYILFIVKLFISLLLKERICMKGSKFAETKMNTPEWYVARRLMREKNKKLIDAAAYFGLTVGGMHRVINGVPNIAQVKKLAEFLEVDFNDMFDFNNT